MSTLLFALANNLMAMFSGGGLLASSSGGDKITTSWGQFAWLKNIVDAVDMVLYPVIALVATAGIIYAVVLGVNLAKAESSEKRDEAKKRMINAIIGFVSVIALIFLMKLVILFLPNILGLYSATNTGSTTP